MAQLTVRIATPDYASLTDDDGKPLIRPEVLRENALRRKSREELIAMSEAKALHIQQIREEIMSALAASDEAELTDKIVSEIEQKMTVNPNLCFISIDGITEGQRDAISRVLILIGIDPGTDISDVKIVPLSAEELQTHLNTIPEWGVTGDHRRMKREIDCKDEAALDTLEEEISTLDCRQIALCFSHGNKLFIELRTPFVSGITLENIELAQQIDQMIAA